MDHSSMGSMAGGSGGAAGGMAAMSFHFGNEETVLFDFWQFSSVWGLIVTCLVLICISIAKEAARSCRSFYAKATERNRNLFSRVVDVLLHAVTMTLSYFLMVIFMNLNVWMSATIVAAEVLCHAFSSHFASQMTVNYFEK